MFIVNFFIHKILHPGLKSRVTTSDMPTALMFFLTNPVRDESSCNPGIYPWESAHTIRSKCRQARPISRFLAYSTGHTTLHQLMKEVALVILYPKLIQHFKVLFSETYSLVMLLLIFDVPVDYIHLRMAVGKASIAGLPFKPVC